MSNKVSIQQLIKDYPPTSFNSVHDYLDKLFVSYRPSNEEIRVAKRAYWSAYNTDLKRRQAKNSQVIGLRFSHVEIAKLQELCTTKHLSPYLKSIVREYLDGDTTPKRADNSHHLIQELHLISQQLEELLLNDAVLDKALQLKIISCLQELQTQLNSP